MRLYENRVSTHTGSFDVVSGVLRVTDPCYGFDVGCAGIVRAAVGKWRWVAEITKFGAILTAHLKLIEPDESEEAWEVEPFQVGVDSGRFGFFEASKYSQGIFNDTFNLSGVYECDHGIASTTGMGDGIFRCRTIKRNGVAIAVRIGDESRDDE